MWAGLALAVMVVSLSEASPSPLSEPLCPDPSEVEEQLVRLGIVGGARPEITIVDDKMRVVLLAQDGTTLGSREVEAPVSCQERATVAAVLVATWMGVWPHSAQAESSPPVVDNPPKPAVAANPEPSKPARQRGVDIGFALLGAHDGNGFASGLAVESRWKLLDPLRGFVGFSATTEREKTVGLGRAGYTRPALEAGPLLRLGSGRVLGELGLSGRLGLLILRGKGLPVTHARTRAMPGAAASLRLVFAGRTLSPFLTVIGATWLGRETAILDDNSATAELPRWDLQVGVGILWARGP
jgi:hypothetical protein